MKDIEIVTPEEKNRILYEFNDRNLDYPSDQSIIEVFEKIAKNCRADTDCSSVSQE